MPKHESFTLLHLSDPQFGKNHRFGNLAAGDGPDATFDTLFERLRLDLEDLKKDAVPDLIAVSGDLAEWGTKGEFADALAFLVRLSECTGIPRERIILVPGNHDINRSLCEAHFLQQKGEDEAPVPPYWPKWKHYAWLFEQFYGTSGGASFTEREPWTFYEIEEYNLVVAALNSTISESHLDGDHFGHVGEAQLRCFAERLAEYAARGWFRIGVIHHNPERGAVQDEENLRDVDDLRRILAPSLNLLLHGHTHESGASYILGRNIPTFSTGSAALKKEQRPEEVGNQYQLIRIWPNRVQRWLRRYDPGQKRWIGDTRYCPRGSDWNLSEAVDFDKVDGTFAVPPPSAVEMPQPHDVQILLSPHLLGIDSLRGGLATPSPIGLPIWGALANDILATVAPLSSGVVPADFDPTRRYVSIPFPSKGEQVIGRGAQLQKLRIQLEEGQPSSIGQTGSFHGLGGLGKTQLAIEYAYAYEAQYPGGVFWFNADQDLDAQLSKLAVDARWIAPGSELRDKLDVAKHQIRSRLNTLVIFDNVEALATIEPYLPEPTAHAHLVLTSRQPVPGFTEVPLELLPPEPALEMLLNESGCLPTNDAEMKAVCAVVQELGCLPLALEIAGAYIKNRPMPWADYLSRLRNRPQEALTGKFVSSWTRHETDLYHTLQVSAELVISEPHLGSILNLLTWSGPAPMGVQLLAALLGVDEPADLSPALGLGVKLKILQETVGHRRFAIHRLVREVRRRDTPLESLEPPPTEIIHRMGAWFLEHREDFTHLPAYEAESDHLAAWQAHATSIAPLEAARLTWLQAYPPYHRGQAQEVRRVIDMALAIFGKAGTQDEALRAHLLNDSGWVESELGNYPESRKLYRAAYDIRREVLGERHPDTADSMASVAGGLLELAQYDQALDLAKAALEIRRAFNPPRPRDVADSLLLLGGVYMDAGEYHAALQTSKEAIKINQQEYGNEHPSTARSEFSLASTLEALGKYEEALSLKEQALAVQIKLLGANHPGVLKSLGSIGSTYGRLMHPEKAIELAKASLAGWEAILAPNHLKIADAKGTLGNAYLGNEDARTALPLLQADFDAQRIIHGEQHPNVAVALGSLCVCHAKLGNFAQAVTHAEGSYNIRVKKLGDRHPVTAGSIHNLGSALVHLGNSQRGLRLLHEALDIRRERLGADHPSTLSTGRSLADVYVVTNDLFKASRLLTELVTAIAPTNPEHASLTSLLGRVEDARRKKQKFVRTRSGDSA